MDETLKNSMCEDWNKWVGELESLGNDDFHSTLFTAQKRSTISNINIFPNIK